MRASVTAGLPLAAVLAMVAAAGCGSTEPDESGDKTPKAECDDSGDVLSIDEQGWSVVEEDSQAVQVSYAAVLSNAAEQAVKNGQLTVRWLDEAGEPIDLAGGVEDTGEQRAIGALPPEADTAVTGYTNLAAEPDSVEFAVNETCRLPADTDLERVDVDEAEVSLDSDSLDASLSLNSSFSDSTDGVVLVIFRDKGGEIVGGGPFAEDAMPEEQSNVLESIPTGESSQQASFDVSNFLPDDAEADESQVYILPV